jgi:hypothetical protein
VQELNKWNCLTFSGAARALGVSLWRLRYAVDSGYLPPPAVVLKLRRLFSPAQVERMREFFEMENTVKARNRSSVGRGRAECHSPCQPTTLALRRGENPTVSAEKGRK